MTDTPPPEFAAASVNLASPRLGAEVVFASDEFFGAKERMIQDAEPVFIPDKYDTHGKWMDGWESRRRRDGGHDYCVIRLDTRGVIEGFDVDTQHFTGNHPPHVSIEGALTEDHTHEDTQWTELVPKTAVNADSHNYIEADCPDRFNHVRLHIYPDGGVARLRVYGHPLPAWERDGPAGVHELSAIANGGRIVGYNDAHYGTPWVILTPGRGADMGDGWETRRRREPGNDWIVVALGAAGTVERLEIDTAHFKGNYPDRASVEGILLAGGGDESGLLGEGAEWRCVMAEEKLEMDKIHTFEGDRVRDIGPVTHLRLSIYPDGGVSRFRAFGKPAGD